jgi:hypothetical protein
MVRQILRVDQSGEWFRLHKISVVIKFRFGQGIGPGARIWSLSL